MLVRKLSISRTVNPDGSVKHYLYGMTPPELVNMGFIMKTAVFDEVQKQSKPQSKLKAA